MAIPHYVNENKSDMWSIKPGWYAMDEDGSLSSGPFSSREECLNMGALSQRTDRPRQSCVYGRGVTIRTYIRPAFRAAGPGADRELPS